MTIQPILQDDPQQNQNIDLARLQRIQEAINSGERTQVLSRPAVPRDANPQEFTEVQLPTVMQPENLLDLVPYPRDLYGRLTISEGMAQVSYLEAARGRAMTTNFPDLLRMGVNFDAMSAFAQYTPIWPLLTGGSTPSMKQQEEYLKDVGMGIASVVGEGKEYPEAAIDLGDGVIIRNYKRGFKFPVTEEMRMFDQLGKVRDLAFQAGRSLAITEEYAVMEVLTTTGNYTANSTTGDNDQGSNTSSATFCASAYETALNTLLTMKDRNGNYLMVNPTIFFCAPKALHYAKRLLMSPELHRTHGATTAEVDGLGQQNPFYGQITTIISSPYIGSDYQWGLLDPSRGALKFQRVAEATVRGPVFKEETDTFWFYPRTWFGVGFKDQRFAYFSTSSTRPTVS